MVIIEINFLLTSIYKLFVSSNYCVKVFGLERV